MIVFSGVNSWRAVRQWVSGVRVRGTYRAFAQTRQHARHFQPRWALYVFDSSIAWPLLHISGLTCFTGFRKGIPRRVFSPGVTASR
jgi:hypothetical protein